MQISLTPEMERALQAKVASGLYRDTADVVYDALRRFLLQDDMDWPLEELRREVGIGVAEANRGEFSDQTISDMISTMEARYPDAKK